MARMLPDDNEETDLALWLKALCDLKQRGVRTINRVKQIRQHNPRRAMDVKRLNQYASSIGKSVEAMTDSYSRAWQLGCATNILRSLPQEIRDMIYKEILGPSGNNDVGHWRFEGGAFADFHHYFDKKYMGTEFVTELSKIFHSEKKFVLRHPGELEGLLSYDRFDSDCKPYEHIRFITVDVSLNLYSISTGKTRDWSSPKFRTPLKQHFLVAVKGLYNLRRLQKAAPILLLRIDCREHNAGPKFAEVLVPLVYELKNKGWVVKVQGKYASKQSDEKWTALDFNYDIVKKEWDKKIKTDSAFATDDADAATKPSRKRFRSY